MPFCNLFFKLQIILFADRNRADGEHKVEAVYSLTFQTVIGISHGLLVEAFQNVLHNLYDTLRRTQCFLGINSGNLLVLLFILLLDRVNIVDAERQHISIINCIHNSVGMELRTKSLLCGSKIRISTCSGIDCENWCASKSKDYDSS